MSPLQRPGGTSAETRFYATGSPTLISSGDVTVLDNSGIKSVTLYRVPASNGQPVPFYRRTEFIFGHFKDVASVVKFVDGDKNENFKVRTAKLDPGLYVIATDAPGDSPFELPVNAPCFLFRVGSDVPGDPSTQPSPLNGTWEGTLSANQINNRTYKIRFVIDQTGSNADIRIFLPTGSSNAFPSLPQESGKTTFVDGVAALQVLTMIKGKPFAANEWKITFLKETGVLHVERHRHYLTPGDKRPDTDTTADLTRTE